MQTRSFSPTCTTSHHFASVDDNIFNRALNAMLSVEVLGITHEYKLSICVIMFKLTKVLPQMCDCNQVFKQYNITCMVYLTITLLGCRLMRVVLLKNTLSTMRNYMLPHYNDLGRCALRREDCRKVIEMYVFDTKINFK